MKTIDLALRKFHKSKNVFDLEQALEAFLSCRECQVDRVLRVKCLWLLRKLAHTSLDIDGILFSVSDLQKQLASRNKSNG